MPTRRTRAFTVIEVAAAVAVAGLLAASVAFSLRSAVAAAALRLSIDRLMESDRSARHAAERTGLQLELVFSATEVRVAGPDHHERRSAMPGGARITTVRTAADAARGPTSITVEPDGSTATYALRLEDGEGRVRWIVFAGRTGHPQEVRDEHQIDAIFSALAGRLYAR